MKELKMGDTAMDYITGFVGTITGRSVYINGCIHLMLEAKVKLGMKPVYAWFDLDRCVFQCTTRKPATRKPATRRTTRPGGPMPHSQ